MHLNNDFRWQYELEVSWHLLVVFHVSKPNHLLSKEFLYTKVSLIFPSHLICSKENSADVRAKTDVSDCDEIQIHLAQPCIPETKCLTSSHCRMEWFVFISSATHTGSVRTRIQYSVFMCAYTVLIAHMLSYCVSLSVVNDFDLNTTEMETWFFSVIW